MASRERQKMKVDCNECGFVKTVDSDDDRLAGDILVDHGECTGHVLSLSEVEK